MDKNRYSGTLQQAQGALKEAAGRLVSNRGLERQGNFDRTTGKAQSIMGGMKDAVREHHSAR